MLLTLVGPLRFRPTMPAGPALALSLFTLGTVLSLTEAQDTGTALSFEGHTLFFVFLAVWLTSALRTNGWTRERCAGTSSARPSAPGSACSRG